MTTHSDPPTLAAASFLTTRRRRRAQCPAACSDTQLHRYPRRHMLSRCWATWTRCAATAWRTRRLIFRRPRRCPTWRPGATTWCRRWCRAGWVLTRTTDSWSTKGTESKALFWFLNLGHIYNRSLPSLPSSACPTAAIWLVTPALLTAFEILFALICAFLE